MAISYRGKNVDMIALEKANATKVALGNAHMNTRGDILGRGGIIVKTREDQLKEWQSRVVEETTIKEKYDTTELEEEVSQMTSKLSKAQGKKNKKQEVIYDDEPEVKND